MDRRSFIKSSCTTCVAGVGMAWLLEACSSHKYISNYSLNANKITIKKTEFLVEKKGETKQQKFILLKPESLQFPIALYEVKENEYKAMYLQCTHQGCELNAYETMMVCPCHGAEFNKNGEVTQGPADQNLRTFITTQDKDNIYIQL